MSKTKINKSAKETVKKKNIKRFLKVGIIVVFLFLINLYVILGFMYQEKSFTVYLEHEDTIERNLVIHETKDDKRYRFHLKADVLDELSATSLEWLPENLNTEADGSHNGNNYIAYTFYAENLGQETINYKSEIIIDDVIRNVDEALRIIVYKNDEKVVYAKASSKNGQPEEGTKAFIDEKTIMSERRENFEVGAVDKYTVVIFIEGNDTECTDALIGGEIGVYMKLTEEKTIEPDPLEEENN
jgi:cell division protein FtsB